MSFALLFLSACGGPIVNNPSPVFTPQPYLYPHTVPFTPGTQYTIQPGDTLDFRYFYNPELNVQSIPVRPDGRISLQLIPEITAAGLTPDELKNLLMQKYESTDLRNIDITVIVRSFSAHKIFVDGEVYRPNLYPLVGPITTLQAIAQAGGMRETARVNEVIIIRRGTDNKLIVTTKNLEKAIDGTDITQDILLMPYDIVYVPRSPIANFNLWIDQYIRRTLPFSVPSPIPQPTWQMQ